MAEDALLGQGLGSLCHGLQLLDQNISVEPASDLGPQAVDGGDDDFTLGLLKQLWQSPAKCTLLILSNNASLLETSSNFWSTALKCCSCSVVMSTIFCYFVQFESQVLKF